VRVMIDFLKDAFSNNKASL